MPDQDPNIKQIKKSRKFNQIYLLILIVAIVGGTVGGAVGAGMMIKRLSGVDTVTGKKNITVEESSATIEAVEKISPSVVSIVSKEEVQDIFGTSSEQTGGGTGFIITSDGLVVTNKHVVDNPRAEYQVFTQDGKNYKAKVKAKDPLNDLAVLEINGKNLPVADLGNSEDLKIGQRVIAIGNALGEFQNTVTTGVVSAKERSLTATGAFGQTTEELQGLIQTDASINPGNSGGPLINLDGQVVGINTAVAASAENIGFAIPINDAKTAIDSVVKEGKIVRPMLGVRYFPLTKDLARYNDLPVDYGAYLYSEGPGAPAIVPGGPADKAGLKANDIIIAIDEQAIDENHSLKRILQNYNPGDTIEITYLRNKKERKTSLTLVEME